MTDHNNSSQTNATPQGGPDVLVRGAGGAAISFREHRRRLLKISVTAPPVIMTLVSRPTLGANLGCDTPSGFLSGNLSRPYTTQSCSGRTPGYWKNHTGTGDWPAPYYPATITGTGGHQATRFHSVFSGSFFGNQTFLEVMQNSSGGGTYDVGNHAAAAILNAAKGWTPVLTVGQVQNIWSEYLSKGYFEPTAGAKWYAPQIVVYLKTTMPL